MEIPAYAIVRPRGVIGRHALDRLQTRRKVLERVILLPYDPGVETFEKVILGEILSSLYPDRIFFQEIEWDFEKLASEWPEVSVELLYAYAAFAWKKIYDMTQPTR